MTSIGPITVDATCIPSQTQPKSSTLAIALGVGIGGGVLLIALIVILLVCCLRRKKQATGSA